jgi:hypothetical protein
MPQTCDIVKRDPKYDGRVILYVIKGAMLFSRTIQHSTYLQSANQTSYLNYIKPLILAAEPACPHIISLIDTREAWYFQIHPEH